MILNMMKIYIKQFMNEVYDVPYVIWFYLFGLGIIGLFFVFRFTPMSGIDEQPHFYRALQVSQGGFFASSKHEAPHNYGGKLDKKLIDYTDYFISHRDRSEASSVREATQLAHQLDNIPEKKIWLTFPSSASYSPIMYIPSAFGLFLAKKLNTGVGIQYFAGRLGNLAGYLSIFALVIILLPLGRIPVLLLFSTPTALHLACAYSADPLSNLLTVLFTIFCLRARTSSQENFNQWKYLILIFAVLLGLLKITYCFFSLTCLFIPTSYFLNKKNYWLYCGTVISLSILSALVWNILYPFNPGSYWHSGGNPHVALHNLFVHPLNVVIILWKTIYQGVQWWWEDLFGRFGGGPVPQFFKIGNHVQILSFLLMIFSIFLERKSQSSKLLGVFLFLCGLVYTLLVIFAFYITFSPISAETVSGLQGRYFFISLFFMIMGILYFIPNHLSCSKLSVVIVITNFLCVTYIGLLATQLYAANWY